MSNARNNGWIKTSEGLPNEGTEVMTKIDDGHGCRNEGTLVYSRRMWWFSDMGMYVYYTPTHWKSIEEDINE